MSELTLLGIKDIMQASANGSHEPRKLVVQVLDFKKIDNGNRTCYSISDGHAKKPAILTGGAQEKHNASGPKKLDIIEIQSFVPKGTQHIIIGGFNVVSSGKSKPIGQPMVWEEFVKANFVNSNGTNKEQTSEGIGNQEGTKMNGAQGGMVNGGNTNQGQGPMGMGMNGNQSHSPTSNGQSMAMTENQKNSNNNGMPNGNGTNNSFNQGMPNGNDMNNPMGMNPMNPMNNGMGMGMVASTSAMGMNPMNNGMNQGFPNQMNGGSSNQFGMGFGSNPPPQMGMSMGSTGQFSSPFNQNQAPPATQAPSLGIGSMLGGSAFMNGQTAPPKAEPLKEEKAEEKAEAPPRPKVKPTPNANYLPISHMTIYNEDWTIRARVISKSDIKTWANEKSSGKFFKTVIGDDSGKIQAMFFNATCDKYWDTIQENGVYVISNGKLKPTSGKYNSTKHDYEISIDEMSKITEEEDDGSCGCSVVLVPLGELKNKKQNDLVDVIGIVFDEGTCEQVEMKFGGNKAKRSIGIVDEAMEKVEVVLWGSLAENPTFSKGSIVAFRQLKMSSFQSTTTLNFSNDSQVLSTFPSDPRVDAVMGLKNNPNFNMEALVSKAVAGPPEKFFNNFHEVSKTVMRMSKNLNDKRFFTIIGYCTKIKSEGLWLASCSNEGCDRKVVETGMGWMCNGCHCSIAKPNYKYTGTVCLADPYRTLWVRVNDKSGRSLFGKEANELHDVQAKDEAQFQKELRRLCMKQRRFTTIVKNESFNNEVKQTFTLTGISEDVKKDTNNMLRMLEAYAAMTK